MKLNSTSSRITLAILAVFLLVIVGSLIVGGDYTTKQTAELSFTIEQDFTEVRKIMVRTNAAKEIVTMGGGSEFIEQQWEGGSVDTGAEKVGQAVLRNVLSSDPNWKLQLHGTLRVRTLDKYIGQAVVTLHQDVDIVPDEILSEVKLQEGSERLLEYAMTTRQFREEDHTRVDLRLTQQIRTEAPWFAHGIADRRVHASAARTLAAQEQAMRQLINDNADKAGLFPLH